MFFNIFFNIKFCQQNEISHVTSSTKNEDVLCLFPDLNPWHPKIRALLKPIPVYNKCASHKPLTYIEDNRLYIDNSIARDHYKNGIGHCQFAPVLRSAVLKESYILGELRNFTSGLELIDEVVKVVCSNASGWVEYEYVHALIFRKEKLKAAVVSPCWNIDLFFISINQIDTCHTTNICKGGWFIRLFKKHLKLIKKVT